MFITKRIRIHVDEKEITKVIDLINTIDDCPHLDYAIGNCGWADQPNEWFVFATVKRKNLKKVMIELNKFINFVDSVL